MHRKHFTLAIFILVSIILYTYAQQDPWGNEESIKSLTPEQIINEPQKAREHWQTLTTEQREAVYQDSRGIKEFSDKFAAEKGLKALDLRLGNAYYDGTNLVNGNTRISVSDLKNAEVIALDGRGFRIKFPDGSDLTVSDFSGAGGNFVMIEGNDLDFGEFFYGGVLDIYDTSHFRMEPNSKYLDLDVEIITSDYPVGLYYGPQDISEEDNIQFDNRRMSIAGQGIHVRFTDGNKFEELVVDGKVTIENGGVTIEFDGEGNAYEEIPLGEPETPLTIEDENAPDKEYVLDPGDKAIEDDGTLEGFGGCACPLLTGNSILDVTGRQVKDSCICQGRMVTTGKNLRDLIINLIVTSYAVNYEAALSMKKEQVDQVLEQFFKIRGSAPDRNSADDLNLLGELVYKHVTDMKLEQVWQKSYKLGSFAKSYAESEFFDSLEKAGLPQDILTNDEKNTLNNMFSEFSQMNNKDKVATQMGGAKGLVTINRVNGKQISFDTSERVVKAILRTFFDNKINDVKGQARDLLDSFYGTITVEKQPKK